MTNAVHPDQTLRRGTRRKAGRPSRLVARQPSGRMSAPALEAKKMVGLDRLELSTSPLSGVRSNHLSYRPGSSEHASGATQQPATTQGQEPKRRKADISKVQEPPGTRQLPHAGRFHHLVSVKKKEKRRRRRPANEVHPKMASMIQVDQPTDRASPVKSLADHP